jgi:hypothetical protein
VSRAYDYYVISLVFGHVVLLSTMQTAAVMNPVVI